MFKKIPQFLIPILFIFAVGLYGQDCFDNNNDGVVDTADYPIADPGPDGGCGDYADCNDNGAYDLGEPCFEGDHPGGGPPQDGDECVCGHVYSGEEDHHGHCPAPTCDVVLDTDEDWEEHCNDDPDHCPEPSGDGGSGGGPPQDGDECDIDLCEHVYSGEEDQHGHCPTCDVVLDTDEDWEEHCNDDPDHCPEPPDGDDGYEEYGEHTVGNCIAFAEGRGSYWIGDEEFAVWDDPNVDCNYLFDQIGYQPPAYMCSWTWGDGNPCGYTSDDPSAFHDHCGYTFSDGNTCDASFDNQGDFDAHQHCGFTFSDGNICGWAPWEDNTFHEHCDQVWPDGNACGASFDNQGDMDAHQGDHADDGGGWYCQICEEHFATEADMDQHAADMEHTDGGCDPDGNYDVDPPGVENLGCIDYDDCNGNTVYDLSEPCYDVD